MRPKNVIEKNRKKLDKITEQIIRLIRERNDAAKEIGRAKRKLGLPVVNLKRRAGVIKNAKKLARKLKVDVNVVEKIMRILINHAEKIQRRPKPIKIKACFFIIF